MSGEIVPFVPQHSGPNQNHQNHQNHQNGSQCQLICGGCRRLLVYPYGSNHVRCELCSVVACVPPQGTQVVYIRCDGCNVTLMYPVGAHAVKCDICQYITCLTPTAEGTETQTVIVENPMTMDDSGSFQQKELKLVNGRARSPIPMSGGKVPVVPQHSGPNQYHQSLQNGSQCHLTCGGCWNVLKYPYGSNLVRCTICGDITSVAPQGTQVLETVEKEESTDEVRMMGLEENETEGELDTDEEDIHLSEIHIPDEFFSRKRIDIDDIRNIIPNGSTLDAGAALKRFSKTCQRMARTSSNWEELCLCGRSSSLSTDTSLRRWGLNGRSALRDIMESGLLANVQDVKFESLSNFGDDGITALATPLESGRLRSLRRLTLQDVGFSSSCSTRTREDWLRHVSEFPEEDLWRDLYSSAATRLLLDCGSDIDSEILSAAIQGPIFDNESDVWSGGTREFVFDNESEVGSSASRELVLDNETEVGSSASREFVFDNETEVRLPMKVDVSDNETEVLSVNLRVDVSDNETEVLSINTRVDVSDNETEVLSVATGVDDSENELGVLSVATLDKRVDVSDNASEVVATLVTRVDVSDNESEVLSGVTRSDASDNESEFLSRAMGRDAYDKQWVVFPCVADNHWAVLPDVSINQWTVSTNVPDNKWATFPESDVYDNNQCTVLPCGSENEAAVLPDICDNQWAMFPKSTSCSSPASSHPCGYGFDNESEDIWRSEPTGAIFRKTTPCSGSASPHIYGSGFDNESEDIWRSEPTGQSVSTDVQTDMSIEMPRHPLRDGSGDASKDAQKEALGDALEIENASQNILQLPDLSRGAMIDTVQDVVGETSKHVSKEAFENDVKHAQGGVPGNMSRDGLQDALDKTHDDLVKDNLKEVMGEKLEGATADSLKMKEFRGIEALGPWLQSAHAQALESLTISGVPDATVQVPRSFSYDDLKLATRNFHTESFPGSEYSKEGYDDLQGVLQDQTEVVVTRFLNDGEGPYQIQSQCFEKEVSILSKIKHKNVIHFLGHCTTENESFLVFELAGRGNLQQALWDRHKPMLDWKKRLKIAMGIARGLWYLHDKLHVIHRDIKPANILLDENSNPKISRFGLAQSKDSAVDRVEGSFGYVAPEYVMELLLTPKADVYAFGILLLNSISGREAVEKDLPTEDMDLPSCARRLESQGRLLELVQPELKGQCSQDEVLKVLLIAVSCTDTNYQQRPTMSRVVLMLHEILHNGVAISALTMLVKSLSLGQANNLSKLELHDSTPGFATSSMVEELATAFGHINSLRQLKLSGDRLGMSAFIILVKCTHLEKLENLELSGYDTGPVGEQLLLLALQSSQIHNLQALKLHCPIEDDDAEVLFKAMERGTFAVLRSLNLASSRLTESGVTAIVRWLQSGRASKLTELLFRGSFCSETHAQCWKLLANACVSPTLLNLETVDLGDPCLENEGLIEVAQALIIGNLPKLRKFPLLDQSKVYSQEVKRAFVTAYKRNKFLTAQLYEGNAYENDDFLRALRELQLSNGKHVEILQGLEDDLPVAATYGKVFLCGSPRVGKTTLRRTLLETFKLKNVFRKSKEEAPTRGIEVSYMQFPQDGSRANDLKLAFWDLAGQHEYEVLHSAFLPDLALADGRATFFVIVCSANAEKSSSTTTAKEALLYWLRFIASNSQKGIRRDLRRKVMVVLNCFHGEQSAHDPEEWKGFLEGCQEAFEEFLHLRTLPFIVNARSRKQTRPLKRHLQSETKAILQQRLVPKICASILQNCKDWVANEPNRAYPVLSWDQYCAAVVPAYRLAEKLNAATIYLHEAGYLILFKALESSRELSTDDGFVHQGVVILDPEWFCHKVIGHVLLPDHLLRHGEKNLVSTYMRQDGSLPLNLVRKDQLDISAGNWEQMVQIFVRLGLGYTLRNDDQHIFIPALIRNDTVPDYFTQKTHGWVMGFSLTSMFSTAMVPVALLRKLQVNMAQDESIGHRDDSEFQAGVSRISCKWKGMGILVEYYGDPVNSQNNRLDVLIKPLFQHDCGFDDNGKLERAKQVRLAQCIVEKTLDIAAECCPGLELRRSVIKPWTCADKLLLLEVRKVTSVDSMKDQLQKEIKKTVAQGEEEADWTTNWEVGGILVKYQDVLGEEDWRNVVGEFENRCELTESALQRLHLLDPQEESHHCKLPTEAEIQIPRSTLIQEKAESSDAVIMKHLQLLRSEVRVLKVEMHERFDHVDNQVGNVADNLRKVLNLQIALNRHVQSLETFTIAEKNASVPRFAFLTGRDGSGSAWISIKDMFTQETFLHFCCEAPHFGSQMHEVEGQLGIDIRSMREWAQRLAPILNWSLKIAFVAAKIAGSAFLPGLGLLFPSMSNDLIGNGSLMTIGISDLLKMCSETVNNTSIDQPVMQAKERELRGPARAILKKILDELSPDDFVRKVGLRRVRILDQYQATMQVAWICNKCFQHYGHRAEEI